MSEETSGERESFDLERLRELMEMMEKHDVTRVSLRHGSEKWNVSRGPQDVVQMVPAAHIPAVAPVPAAAPAPPAAEAPAAVESGLFIKSPTVGTFYTAPNPDDPPYVTVGKKVQADTVVCIVEAMKVFNQIVAELDGTIVEILVNNGDPVEFGQSLFRVQLG
jgi:acetyl-CoA carboxylase biotin carboxyl carrier protein